MFFLGYICRKFGKIGTGMKEPRVTIIVLNWNGKELTLDCLTSLNNISYQNAKILVVDNGSADGSVEAIHSRFPDVEVLSLENNLGYASGNNVGFQHIRDNNSDFIIFLNNDTIVDPEFVQPLVSQFINSEVGQTVPKIYYADDPDRIWFGGSRINLWTGTISHEGIRDKDGPDFNSVKSADYATGCCFCIRVHEFGQLNGFDESFPMYAEDVDLSLRIRERGKKVLFIPESKVWHKVSASLGGAFSIRKIWRRQKGNWKLMWKHRKGIKAISGILLSPFSILVRIMKIR